MSHCHEPRERWRWDEREDRGLEREERFARHGGDPRWGTGGLRVWGAPCPVRSARDAVRPSNPYQPGERENAGGERSVDDERIRRDVRERFLVCGDLDVSDVQVTVTAGEIVLLGVVGTRAQKRLADDLANGVPGVVDVHNRLRLKWML